MKNQNLQNTFASGLDKIKAIKKEIASYESPKLCKVEVYKMWEDIPSENIRD